MKHPDHLEDATEASCEFSEGLSELKALLHLDYIGHYSGGANLNLGYLGLYEIVNALKSRPRPAISDNTIVLGARVQPTSAKAGEKALPRSGSLRKRVHDLVRSAKGLTDEELEKYTGGKHQSISASRNSLVRDGYLMDSGTTRKNTSGNDCIVWVTTEVKTTLF